MDFGSSRSTCLRYWGNTPPQDASDYQDGFSCYVVMQKGSKRYRPPTVPTLAFFFHWHPRRWTTRDKMFQIDNVFSGGMKRLVDMVR